MHTIRSAKVVMAIFFFTGEDDLADIIEEIVSIKSVYFSLGRSLRLRPDDLRAVSEACGSTGTGTGAGKESDHNYTERALNDVVLLWLRQNTMLRDLALLPGECWQRLWTSMLVEMTMSWPRKLL